MRRGLAFLSVGAAVFAACGESSREPVDAGEESAAGGWTLPRKPGNPPVDEPEGEPGGAPGEPPRGDGGAAPRMPVKGVSGSGGSGAMIVAGAGGEESEDDGLSDGGEPSEGPVTGRIERALGVSAGATVRINGVSKLTAADGTFAFEDVPPEYELTVVDGALHEAKVIEGLTTRHPVVMLGQLSWENGAAVAGTVTGDVSLPAADHVTAVGFLSSLAAVSANLRDQDGDRFALKDVKWGGPESTEGELLALQWKVSGVSRQFSGFARRALTLSNAANLAASTATALELVQPKVVAYSGSLTSPEDDKPLVWLEVGPFTVSVLPLHGAFTVEVPSVDLPVGMRVKAAPNLGDAWDVYMPPPAPGKAWRVTVPTMPERTAPRELADVTLASEFAWRGMPEHAVAHSTWLLGSWKVERVTTRTSITIPDLTADGVPAEAGVATWMLDAVGPALKPEQSLAIKASMARHVPVRHFSSYLARVFGLVAKKP